jgi:hypothetical protein
MTPHRKRIDLAHPKAQDIGDIARKFLLLDDGNKYVFQQLVVLEGVKTIIEWQTVGFIRDKLMMPLILFIDMIDQRAGCGLRYSEVNHMMAGPREFVRFFHRRSACSCLKDWYYHLKDNTQSRYYAMVARK